MYYEKIMFGYPVCNNAGSEIYVILKDKSLPVDTNEYLFLLRKMISGKKMLEVAQWCDENLKDDYLVGKDTSGFKDEADAMAFKLRWI